MTNQDEIWRRVRIVERVIETDGWSVRIADGLAKELGVSRKTIYDYRAKLLQQLSKRRMTTELEAEQFLAKVRGFQQEARKNGSYGPLAGMLAIEAKVLGIDKLKVEVTGKDGGPVETSTLTEAERAERLRRIKEAYGE